jgi:type III secretion protein L
MVIWFRDGPCTVGFENGLIKGADFARVLSLLELNATMETRAEQVLQQAHAQAEQLLAEARRQAEAMLEDARAQHSRGFDQGFEKGQREGLRAWTTRALEDAAQGRRALDKQRDRLGSLVAMAVERVVEQEDKQAMFQRALRAVSTLLQQVPLLTLRVHQSDSDSARRAVDKVLTTVGCDARIEVISDTRLASGSCQLESDHGVIDAGLQTQLAAIKRAAIRAARGMSTIPSEEQAVRSVDDPSAEMAFDVGQEVGALADDAAS